MAQDRALSAMTNRSIRTIRTELEFLADSSLLTPQQLSTILSQLPSESTSSQTHRNSSSSALHTPFSNLSLNNNNNNNNTTPTPNPSAHDALNEKQGYYAPTSPPPNYNNPAPLLTATALYAYNPTDVGDLALAPNDRVSVLEFMNADWWKGRSERTGQEGIFPRSYVREEQQPPQGGAGIQSPQPLRQQNSANGPMSYGNMPVAVAQGQGGAMQAQDPRVPSKGEEQAKKFGKKLGNAAIFGAGATIGSNIVNSIF